MAGSGIERIRRVPVREVWAHEAHDFTTWLEQNLDILNDSLAVGLDVETVKREANAGTFSVDLVVEDDNGDTVVIENQFGKSDHDHLGKVLTYTAAFDATVAIWIVGEPRPEHVKAVTWLNDSSPLNAYVFKIEAVRIGDSAAAPLLTLIVGPSVDSKLIAASKQDSSARHEGRRAFYDALLAHAGTQTKLHSGRSGTSAPYLSGPSGFAGINLTYGLTQHGTTVILWIEHGPDWAAWNDAVYQGLVSHRVEIEAAFGGPLTFEAKDTNRSRKLIFALDKGGWSDPEAWPAVIESTVDAMIRLEAAVKPFLAGAVASAKALVPSDAAGLGDPAEAP
jgi:hypothetical protein